MSLAFLLHALPSPFPRPTTTPCTTTTAARSRPRVMACMSPHVPSPARIDFGNEPPAREIPHVPEIAAVSPTICEFMNTERLRDLAQYIVNFGTKFDDLSQLSSVRMTTVDAVGFTADVIACDELDCVCVQERLDWPSGLCQNTADVINALKHLSAACDLPTDF